MMNQKADQMLEYYEVLNRKYKWENGLTKQFAALYFVQKKVPVQLERMDAILSAIKSKTGVFSNFRGPSKLMMATLLSTHEGDPNTLVESVLASEMLLKEAGFKNNSYMPITSYVLMASAEDYDRKGVASRAFTLYQEMKKAYPFLTDGADAPLSILMATVSGKMDRAEYYYKTFASGSFSKGNELQLLSHMISLSEESAPLLIQKCEALYDALRKNKLKTYIGMYPSIGLLAITGYDNVSNLIELTKYIQKQKHFKWSEKGSNLLIAASLIVSEWIDQQSESGMDSVVVASVVGTTIESVIIAQTIAVIAAASAASIAATTSS